MRWLFLFVLMLNVAYIAWELERVPNDVPLKKVSSRQAPPLVLISELDQSKLEPVSPAAELATTEQISKSIDVVEKTKPKKPAAEKEKKPVEPIKTAELKVAKTKNPELFVEACSTLGPFRELNKLRVFTRKIIDYVVDVSFRSREEQEISLFWVYLAPEKNSKAAHKLSKRLISKKIRDYYIITSGQKKNGVSLGHFKDKARASKHANRLKKLGFNAEVETVFRTYVIYWLDYKNKKGIKIPDKIFEKYMTNRMNKFDRKCI